ncbi:putative ubiquitin-conjugating enzyme [Xylona heveae TC161]|uniref:Putative ubiquitin-conjugating enzyme n=1 Tax=Xylona heveae (strain CBS 132557 / TC161) TaxID=1328760 RepID=A0A165HKW2_XYLHT|nr:putative ubiquitin-conjugating enzyme [Xylona heveae TC161]KZF23666.1 putative ubiquitin-conjugating enzyme [Xylona heveae TC161]
MSSSHGAAKRLLQELKFYSQDPNDALISLGPVSDDQLFHWEAVMKGVNGTAYEGGLWKLDIRVPENYPLAPPEVKFVTPICHPNVHFKTGEICLDLFKSSWSPAYTITQTLTSVHHLLSDPEPDSPLNVDIAQLLRAGDKLGADSLVRYYTREFRYKN